MAARTDRPKSTPVTDMLTGTLRTAPVAASLRSGARMLTADGIGLLVVDNRDGNLAGVVSERDLVAAVADDVDLDAERLGDLMADEVVTIDADESVGVAATRMLDADVRHLVVVDASRRPLGVVSMRDVMRRVVSTAMVAP